MNHAESSVKVYYSKNYNLFTSINGNRNINKSKVASIVNDIYNDSDLLRYYPILVIEKDGRLYIIDGQHRFAAAIETGSNVWYILAEEFTLLQIAKANANISHWKVGDYLNLYIKTENKNYIILNDYLKKTRFPFSKALLLLSTGELGGNGGAGKNFQKIFQEGKFEVNYEGKANMFWSIIESFKRFPGHNSRSFIVAIDVILKEDKLNFSLLIEKFNNNNPEALKKAGSPEEYIQTLTTIYNK